MHVFRRLQGFIAVVVEFHRIRDQLIVATHSAQVVELSWCSVAPLELL